jgi:glucoamylase
MYFGKSAGSAQPLVWAHSEYIKLLRSAADGCVFDRIQVVYERYAKSEARHERKPVEIFQLQRTVADIPAGHILRVLDGKRFRVVWTVDGWASTHVAEAVAVGYPGFYVDIPTAEDKSSVIEFSIFWPEENRWLDHNKTVRVLNDK